MVKKTDIILFVTDCSNEAISAEKLLRKELQYNTIVSIHTDSIIEKCRIKEEAVKKLVSWINYTIDDHHPEIVLITTNKYDVDEYNLSAIKDRDWGDTHCFVKVIDTYEEKDITDYVNRRRYTYQDNLRKVEYHKLASSVHKDDTEFYEFELSDKSVIVIDMLEPHRNWSSRIDVNYMKEEENDLFRKNLSALWVKTEVSDSIFFMLDHIMYEFIHLGNDIFTIHEISKCDFESDMSICAKEYLESINVAFIDSCAFPKLYDAAQSYIILSRMNYRIKTMEDSTENAEPLQSADDILTEQEDMINDALVKTQEHRSSLRPKKLY